MQRHGIIMRRCKITAIIKNVAGVSVKTEIIEDKETRVCDYLISEERWKNFSFSEGDELSDEDAAALAAEADFCRAAARALKILSYSSHSKSALVRKLCQYGFDKETALRAASEMEDRGNLDECRQAEHLAEYYMRHKYWGKKRIAAELMSRGYCKDAVLSAIGGIDEDRFADNLDRLVARKPVPEDRHERDKYISALSRMGYSLPEILRAIER